MSSLPESEKLDEVEFKWGKKRGVGGKNKEVRFYESFTYDGVEYALYDCVFMYKEGEPAPYIAKLVKIWENGDKSKRIKVHWFFRPSEISNYLKDVEVSENELFFASGKGTGLANINLLEPIAGKCNVVCISTDNRNPQPSAKEIQMADYLFYRVFDVESLTISDKMDDEVGGIEVKYVFNRRECVSTLVSSDIDEERNVVACKEVPQLAGKNSTHQLNSVKQDNNGGRMLEEDKNKTPALLKQRSLLGNSSKNRASTGTSIKKRSISGAENDGGDVSGGKDEFKDIKSPANEVQDDKAVESARKDCSLADAPTDGTALSLKVEDVSDVHSLHLVTGAAAAINGEPESELKDSIGCAKDVKLAGNSSSLDTKLSKMKYSLSKKAAISGHSKDAAGLQNESKLNKDLNASQEKLSKSNSFPSREISESAHEDSIRAEKDNKHGNLSACRNMPSISNVSPCGETPRPSTTNILPNGTPKSGTDKDFEGSRQAAKLIQSSTTMERPLKRSADLTKEKLIVGHEKSHDIKYKKRGSSSCPKEEGSLKKAKFDDSIKQMETSKDDTIKKLKEKNCVGETKNSPKLAASYENKPKSKLGEAALKDYHIKEKDGKLSIDNLHDPLISRSKGGEKVGVQVIEVTRRPTEKSKWIKLTWEEKMKTAHDENKLVLLQNLDPEYTSGEVEDIMWNVFQERCTAKMVQRTAISNPHSGQAYVVFGSRDAANRVLQKLDDGCLMLPNQRPLVGCLGFLPKLSVKQRPFFGHLSIDKARHLMHRETKDAVATSHYSQNNTIEYEMAMDWCVLQSRSDKWWRLLHQQQRRELAKLRETYLLSINPTS
ncbi:hypothetical protein ACS0TY_012380 [Phlomoides rotata]